MGKAKIVNVATIIFMSTEWLPNLFYITIFAIVLLIVYLIGTHSSKRKAGRELSKENIDHSEITQETTNQKDREEPSVDTKLRSLVFLIFGISFIITFASFFLTTASTTDMNDLTLLALIWSVITSFALVLLSYWVWQDRGKLEERLRKLEKQKE